MFPPSNGTTTTHIVPADSEELDPAALPAATRIVAAYKRRLGVRAVERFALAA
ncbi:hypothetical protein [Streptomyces mirabilis]|uniref:hypothetical protein n=1 Tax=Streptomyces mirabilis TaxID=68239 RepID=UPI0036ECCCA2